MSWITMKKQAVAPQSPAADFATMYVDANGDFAFKLDNGTLRTISASYQEANGTTNHATTSNVYAQVNNMSMSLNAGNYALWFNATATQTGSGFIASYAVFVDGVLQTQTERDFHNVSGHSHDITAPISTVVKFSLLSAATIEIRFKTTGGTFTIGKRTMIAHKGG